MTNSDRFKDPDRLDEDLAEANLEMAIKMGLIEEDEDKGRSAQIEAILNIVIPEDEEEVE